MDKKKDTPAEVETVTVTMSRPVAEAVQAACEMYLRLHMGQFNDLAEDLCMAKHYADMDAKRFKNAEDEKEDFYRALENRNMMQDDMDAMIRGAFRACLEELDDAPKVEVQEWRRASDPPPTHNETWNDGNETYSGETSMKVWAHCADGTQHEAHYEIHDGTGQWFVEGQDDRFDEHGNVTHWMYYPAAPKD